MSSKPGVVIRPVELSACFNFSAQVFGLFFAYVCRQALISRTGLFPALPEENVGLRED